MNGRSTLHRIGWVHLLIAALVIVGTPFGIAVARQLASDGPSPATGHAQVVTQGVAELPSGDVVWRLVERGAQPRNLAKPGNRVLGFVLASDEPILLTDETAGGPQDVARLAPGEAFWVRSGVRQTRASLGDSSTRYLALELVPADTADEVGSGTLLFTSDPFTPPAGSRDIDLVRNILTLGESATLPDSGEAVVVLATEGAVDVVPSGGRARTLQAGESATFTGELEIEAVQSTSGAKRAPVSALTRSLAQESSASAAYVVAVIGPEIPPPPPPATPTPVATVTPTASPTEVPTEEPPIEQPTEAPTSFPTEAPTEVPTATATTEPTAEPTVVRPVDTDGDGLNDGDEIAIGTSPRLPDTDGDGWSDGREVEAGTNPLDPRDFPGQVRGGE